MQYASENIIPVTLELGGKSPNIFFADVMAEDDDFFDKALDGFSMFALNQGEICTCPSRALVHESIYDRFMERAIARVGRMKPGDPLDADTSMGAQASNDQLQKILSYLDIGRQEGAKTLTGGARANLGPDLAEGFYVQPTVLEGHDSMRVFQEEIFGPVLSVTRFRDDAEGAGAGQRHDLRPRRRHLDARRPSRLPHGPRHPGRPGPDQLLPPVSGACGVRRLQESGIGRENHRMMLDHYQQTENMLVSHSPKALGFF